MQKNKITEIILHWSASGKKTDVATIRSWHKARGWRDIGYHRVILFPGIIDKNFKPTDLIKEGRPLDNDQYLESWEVGAHTLGHNLSTVGVCLIGNIDYSLHPAQALALLAAGEILLERFGLTWHDVRGHRDYMSTQCPGKEIYALLQRIKALPSKELEKGLKAIKAEYEQALLDLTKPKVNDKK